MNKSESTQIVLEPSVKFSIVIAGKEVYNNKINDAFSSIRCCPDAFDNFVTFASEGLSALCDSGTASCEDVVAVMNVIKVMHSISK